jgi:hypothetical protein
LAANVELLTSRAPAPTFTLQVARGVGVPPSAGTGDGRSAPWFISVCLLACACVLGRCSPVVVGLCRDLTS